MEYLKLIALKIDDFCSSIVFEANYGFEDMEELEAKKNDLDAQGCKCLVAKMSSNLWVE